MNKITFRVYAWLFISTGIFALIGSLYTWGEGFLFAQDDVTKSLIPLADLIVSAPFSLIAGVGLWRKKTWGIIFGLLTSGVYFFGSVQVYIMIFSKGYPYPMQMFIPPIFGLGIASGFLIWVSKNQYK